MTNKIKMRRSHSLYAILTLLFLSMVGCKSSKDIATVETGTAKTHAAFFDSMQKQSFQFTTLSARMNVNLSLSDKKMNSRIDMKMVRDSALLLSVQPFMGIEVFRIEMGRDSMKVLDRMNKRYFAESFTNLKKDLPIAFYYNNLQSLLINHLFLPGENTVTKKMYNRFHLNQENNLAKIQLKDKTGLHYTFMADGEEKLLSTIISDKKEHFVLQWLYSNFRLTDKQPFPMSMDIQLLEEGSSLGDIKITFSRIQADVPVQIQTSIPAKYQRISWNDLVKAFRQDNN